MKNVIKKISIAALCGVLILSSANVNVMAKPKVKISKKSITITVGKTRKLKLKNNRKKVKWKSLNKKIATVSKKGVVKGKKKGRTTIVAKVGKKKYKCRVKVIARKKVKSDPVKEIRDPNKMYVDLKYDKNIGYYCSQYQVSWVNNVLTKEKIEIAGFVVLDMKYKLTEKDNGKYDLTVNCTVKKIFDRYGNKAETTFWVGLQFYLNNTCLSGIGLPVSCKTNEIYKVEYTYEDINVGQYKISVYGPTDNRINY